MQTELQTNTVCGAGNEVVHSMYSMSLDCLRLILLALTHVRYLKEDLSDANFYVEIAAQEWHEVYGSGMNNSYGQLKTAVDKLQHTQAATIHIPAGEGYIKRAWFSEANYQEKKGYVSLCFSDKIRPNLANLKGGFYTKLDLIDIRHFKSVYSIRIFLMLMQFRKTGWAYVAIDELREELMLLDKYQQFNSFKRKVLDMAVREINDHTQWHVRYEYKKRGPQIVGIKFVFHKAT